MKSLHQEDRNIPKVAQTSLTVISRQPPIRILANRRNNSLYTLINFPVEMIRVLAEAARNSRTATAEDLYNLADYK